MARPTKTEKKLTLEERLTILVSGLLANSAYANWDNRTLVEKALKVIKEIDKETQKLVD